MFDRSSLLGLLLGGLFIGALVVVRPLFGDRWPFLAEGALGGLIVAAAVWLGRSARRARMGRVFEIALALVAAYGIYLLVPDVPDLLLPTRQIDVTVDRVIEDHILPTGVRVSVRTSSGQVYDAPFFVTIEGDSSGPATLTVGGFTGRVVQLTSLGASGG